MRRIMLLAVILALVSLATPASANPNPCALGCVAPQSTELTYSQ